MRPENHGCNVWSSQCCNSARGRAQRVGERALNLRLKFDSEAHCSVQSVYCDLASYEVPGMTEVLPDLRAPIVAAWREMVAFRRGMKITSRKGAKAQSISESAVCWRPLRPQATAAWPRVRFVMDA